MTLSTEAAAITQNQHYTGWATVLGLGLADFGYALFDGWGLLIGFFVGCGSAITISGVRQNKTSAGREVKNAASGDATISTVAGTLGDGLC